MNRDWMRNRLESYLRILDAWEMADLTDSRSVKEDATNQMAPSDADGP
jgi:hypothetical protein